MAFLIIVKNIVRKAKLSFYLFKSNSDATDLGGGGCVRGAAPHPLKF